MGVHNSFVRSLVLDNWKVEHLATVSVGGNTRAETYIKENDLEGLKGTDLYGSAAMVEVRLNRINFKILIKLVCNK